MSQSNITIVDTSNGGDNHSGPVSPVIRRRKVMFADEVHEGQNGDQEPQDRSDSMKYEEKQSVFGLRPWSAKMRYVLILKINITLSGELDVPPSARYCRKMHE